MGNIRYTKIILYNNTDHIVLDLGIQAAQQTLESEFSLQTLQNIAHNLPVLAK